MLSGIYLEDLAKKAQPVGPYSGHLRIVLRYAAMVAAQQGIELEGLKCQMAFINVPLRPYTQRHNSDFPIEEKMVYKTAIMDVPLLARNPASGSRETSD